MEKFIWAIVPKDSKDYSRYFVGLSHQPATAGQIILSVNNSTTIGVTGKSDSHDCHDHDHKSHDSHDHKSESSVILIGKAVVRDNGKCVAGSWCDCNGGIAVPGSKYNVLKRVSSNSIEVLLL